MLPFAREARQSNLVVAIPAGNRPAVAAGGGSAGGDGAGTARTAGGGTATSGGGGGVGPQEVVVFIQNFE